jgi:hypothetical protein
LHVTFGLTVEKLWGFEDFSPSSGMLSATVNAGKSAQICPKLPRACFHRLDFQSKNFSYAIFIVKKRPLYVNFYIPLRGK